MWAAVPYSALLTAGLGSSEEIGQVSMLAWEAGQLLDYLERSDADPVARARIEFLLLPFSSTPRPAQALSSALQNDPALFVELVTYVSGLEGESPEEASEQRQAIATYGYNALLAWRTPPGLTEAGTIDEAALKTWVTEARRQLAEAKRAEIGDGLIGQVLAHLPPDPDRLWPSRPVLDLIEDLSSSRLESGLQNGKFNSRGVQSRDIRAGGDPERSLVKTYRGWATPWLTRTLELPPCSDVSQITTANGHAVRTTSPPTSWTRDDAPGRILRLRLDQLPRPSPSGIGEPTTAGDISEIDADPVGAHSRHKSGEEIPRPE